MATPNRSRAWVYTLNNYTPEELASLKELTTRPKGPVYNVYAEEVGDAGTPHVQGYLYYRNPRAWSSVSSQIPRAFMEPAKGSCASNLDYIKGPYNKNGKSKPVNPTAIELGTPPKQGNRIDIQDVCELVQQGQSMREIVPLATSCQSVRMAEISLRYFEPKRDYMTNIYWFYGSTGTGKTTKALALCDDPYMAMDTDKWWDGYDAHSDVIIDDYRASFCKFSTLLKLGNQAPHAIETKGGTRQFRARRIFITTPYSVDRTWSSRTSEDICQLKRRIVQELDFDNLPVNKILDYYNNGVQENIQEILL